MPCTVWWATIPVQPPGWSIAEGNEGGHDFYDPFGSVLTSTLPATLTDRLFTGQRWDATLGLYDYRARFYAPLLGQFTQPDSLVPDPLNPLAPTIALWSFRKQPKA